MAKALQLIAKGQPPKPKPEKIKTPQNAQGSVSLPASEDSPPLSSLNAAKSALELAVEQRALDPVALKIAQLSNVGDYFVICSGTSQRHTQGIADKMQEKMKSLGHNLIRSSGYENGEWIILDYGDVVAHIFYEPARHYYQLDDLWSKAQVVELEGRLAQEAKKLRTGVV